MNLKILICLSLLLGGCVSTHVPGNAAQHSAAAVSPPAVLSATVIECIYQQGCHPLAP